MPFQLNDSQIMIENFIFCEKTELDKKKLENKKVFG